MLFFIKNNSNKDLAKIKLAKCHPPTLRYRMAFRARLEPFQFVMRRVIDESNNTAKRLLISMTFYAPKQPGELSMQKVKVHRYISGKRPEYAQYESSDESTEDDFSDRKAQRIFANRGDEISMDLGRERAYDDNEQPVDEDDESTSADPRLRRLMQARKGDRDEGERMERHRHIHEPEIEESEDDSDDDEHTNDLLASSSFADAENRTRRIALGSDSESEPELSDTEIESRRQRLRNKMMQQRKEEEVLMKEEEKQSSSAESESSEYETESESEEAENEPRLKPLFVRKRDRATIAEKEKEAAKQRQIEYEAKKAAKERRRQTLKIVEDTIKKDLEKAKVTE